MSDNAPSSTLSSGQRKKARKVHNFFQLINNFSFLLVNGSIVTLYALKAGAPISLLGLISSLNFLSFMCVPLGQLLSRYLGVVKVYAWAWLLRYLSMIPILGVPFFLIAEKNDIAVLLMFISSVGFNLFRGIGMVGNNPVIASMTTEKERSRYIALVFMISFLANTVGALFLVLVLEATGNSIWAYAGLFFVGIVCGIWASAYVFSFPEAPKKEHKQNLINVVSQAMKRQSFRIFILTYFGISFTVAMVRPFAVLYTKEVYNQSDSISILYTSVGFLGSLLMGAFSRLTVNFVGTKALYIFYTIVSVISLIPAVVSPALSGISLVVFLLLFHFISNLGMQGIESNSQTYLFGVIRSGEISDIFTFYYMIYGFGGAIGSMVAGELLNITHHLGLTTVEGYRIFFLIAFSLFLVLLFFLTRLQNTGKHSVSESLSYIFSVRDMRALSLANRLEETVRPREQLQILSEMSRSESDVSEDFLLETLTSPREEIRHQALYAIESMPTLKDRKLIMALIRELHCSPYTTAYISARILGKMKIMRSVPEVRTCILSPDYRLQAEAIYALAEMKDAQSLPKMLTLLKPTTNPYVLVRLFAALEKMVSAKHVRIFFRPLYWQRSTPELVREALLSGAAVLGMLDMFYPLYCVFLKNHQDGYQALLELYQSFPKKQQLAQLPPTIFNTETKGKALIRACEAIWAEIFTRPEESERVMYGSLHNPILIRHESFRFLMASYIVKHVRREKRILLQTNDA